VPRGYRTPPERIAVWKAEYEAGASLREIEARHGVDHSYLSRALRKAGCEMRPALNAAVAIPEDQIAAMVQGYAAGATVQQIERHFGWDSKKILRTLREHGVRIRPTGRKPGSGTAQRWHRMAWDLRQRGFKYVEISAHLGVSIESARMAVMRVNKANKAMAEELL
jgi:hypothetical protein